MSVAATMLEVCEAVTFAATLLAQFERDARLADRDRAASARVRAMLERAERTLYGRPQGGEGIAEEVPNDRD